MVGAVDLALASRRDRSGPRADHDHRGRRSGRGAGQADRGPHRRLAVRASLAAGARAPRLRGRDRCGPHHLHEAVATEALHAGLHVLLEKPLAPTVEACERILSTAATAGTVFMVAENAQYWPEVLTVRDLIHDARSATSSRRAPDVLPRPRRLLRRRATVAVQPRRRGRWRRDRHGLAWLRPLRVWLGEASEVVAALGYPHPDMEGESLCRALLRFESERLPR